MLSKPKGTVTMAAASTCGSSATGGRAGCSESAPGLGADSSPLLKAGHCVCRLHRLHTLLERHAMCSAYTYQCCYSCFQKELELVQQGMLFLKKKTKQTKTRDTFIFLYLSFLKATVTPLNPSRNAQYW